MLVVNQNMKRYKESLFPQVDYNLIEDNKGHRHEKLTRNIKYLGLLWPGNTRQDMNLVF